MLDWTKSNYSQCRAILEQVSVTLTEWQTLLEEFFHRPTYEWVIQRAMDSGELPMNDQWDEHEWIYPTFPWIDQLKEAQAQGLQVDRGFTTHADVVKAKGHDRDEVLVQLEGEVRQAIDIAKKIEASTGVKVPWETFAGRLPALVASPAAQPAQDPASSEDQAQDEEDKKPTNQTVVNGDLVVQIPRGQTIIENKVQPTPVTIENKTEVQVEPTPVTVAAPEVTVEAALINVAVNPTPVLVKNENSIQLPQMKSKVTFADDGKTAEIERTVVAPEGGKS